MSQKELIKKIVYYICSHQKEPHVFREIRRGYSAFGIAERVDCLKQSQRVLLGLSGDNIIDTNLSDYIRLFESLSYDYSEVDRLLEKYVFFNMENYKGLAAVDRIPSYFREIVGACLCLKDLRLFKIIIEDCDFWQYEWCRFDVNKTEETKQDEDEKYKIIKTEIRHSTKKVDIYNIISVIQKNHYDNLILNTRLQNLLLLINANLAGNEARMLYEEHGEVLHLFKTRDIDYIQKEFLQRNFDLEKSPNVDLKKISDILHSLVDRRAISFLYLHVATKFPIGDIDSSLLIEDIISYPDLLDELVKNEYWIYNQSSLTTWLKSLPEDYWTDDYKIFLKDQFELLFAEKFAIKPYFVIEKDGVFYYGLKNASLKKWKSEFFHNDFSTYPVTIVTEMILENVKTLLANILRIDKDRISIWEKHLLPSVIVIVSEFSNNAWRLTVEHNTKATIRSIVDINGELYKSIFRKQHICIKCNHQIDDMSYIYPKNRTKYYRKIANYQNYFTEMELKDLFHK